MGNGYRPKTLRVILCPVANKTPLRGSGHAQQQEPRHTNELMRAIRRDPHAYQLSFSNYHHYYRYWYCSFRYFEDDAHTQNATENEHLLKHTRRTEGWVSERLNIIFIDPHYITRPVPHDNKLIDRELETYPDRIQHERTALYIRKRS